MTPCPSSGAVVAVEPAPIPPPDRAVPALKSRKWASHVVSPEVDVRVTWGSKSDTAARTAFGPLCLSEANGRCGDEISGAASERLNDTSARVYAVVS